MGAYSLLHVFAGASAFVPASIVVLGAMCILIVNSFVKGFSRSLNVALSTVFIFIDFVFVIGSKSTISQPSIGILSQAVMLVVSLLLILSLISKDRFDEFQTQEFYPLFLFMLAGLQVMVVSDNLILTFIGIELGSLPLATIVALNGKKSGLEAGVKYFLTGVLASIFYVFGSMLIYLSTFTLDITDISNSLTHVIGSNNRLLVLLPVVGLIFIIGAMGFKLSLVPWHSWMPDVYQGNNPIVVGFVSIVPKVAGFVVMLKVFTPISSQIDYISDFPIVASLLYLLVILTMFVPNFMALLQKDVKRMLAYSSISHSALALVCVYLGDVQALFTYWVLFAITNVGVFCTLWLFNSCDNGTVQDEYYDYSYARFYGLAKSSPFLATLLVVFMVSLAGIPPFSMFWGKIFVVTSALSKGYVFLAGIVLLNSAISAFYYLRLIVCVLSLPPDGGLRIRPAISFSRFSGAVGTVSAILCCFSVFLFSVLYNGVSILE